jgi:hypothetical protein
LGLIIIYTPENCISQDKSSKEEKTKNAQIALANYCPKKPNS